MEAELLAARLKNVTSVEHEVYTLQLVDGYASTYKTIYGIHPQTNLYEVMDRKAARLIARARDRESEGKTTFPAQRVEKVLEFRAKRELTDKEKGNLEIMNKLVSEDKNRRLVRAEDSVGDEYIVMPFNVGVEAKETDKEYANKMYIYCRKGLFVVDLKKALFKLSPESGRDFVKKLDWDFLQETVMMSGDFLELISETFPGQIDTPLKVGVGVKVDCWFDQTKNLDAALKRLS